jgi:hypothetical protein
MRAGVARDSQTIDVRQPQVADYEIQAVLIDEADRLGSRGRSYAATSKWPEHSLPARE